MTTPSLRSLAAFSLLLTIPFAATARAQCAYTWTTGAFGNGANDTVNALAYLPNGDLIAGGRFTDMSGTLVDRIARWNGAGWNPLGTGADADVYALATLANGDLLAGGAFNTAGGVASRGIARWNGTTWTALGTGIDAIVPFGAGVQAIAELANGDVVIGGSFAGVSGTAAANIARWNGTSWSALGTGTNGAVRGLAVLANGDLLATGGFVQAGGVVCNSIARWNGSTWSALGTGLGFFGGTSLAVRPNGDVIVGGSFLTAGGLPCNRIARWNGAAWSALGTGVDGPVAALRTLPSGDVLVGGGFATAGGVAASRIAKWNGTTWSAISGGLNVGSTMHDVVMSVFGDVVAAGDFTSAGGSPANRIARVNSSCGPLGGPFGIGCSGAGGPNTLAVTAMPVIGGTFRAAGTGMPPIGLVLAVTGLTSVNLQLSLVLPQSLPNCFLFASPDAIEVVVPNAGTARSALGLAANPALLGVTFYHQYVPLELDLAFDITAVSASNALQLQIGSF